MSWLMKWVNEWIEDSLDGNRTSRIFWIGSLVGGFGGGFIVFISRNFETKKILRGIKKIPLVKGVIEKEKMGAGKKLEDAIRKVTLEGMPVFTELPLNGMNSSEIEKCFKEMKDHEEVKWRKGRISGAVYVSNDSNHENLLNMAYSTFSLSNPLHPDVFPATRKFESEILSMCSCMMRGDSVGAVGAMTSGGTESILMAMRAARNWGYNVLGISEDVVLEIIIPRTAHPAFFKAANYFAMKIVPIEVDPVTFKADPVATEKAIVKGRTVILVASAMGYPHGIVDDVPTFSEIALRNNLLLHVDCCLGGFILPFARQLQFVDESGVSKPLALPNFDFSVKGVTSISMDTHKYGYSTKGTSVVLFRTLQLRRQMYFAEPNWPGGLYASPTMLGSRAGGLIAACWASMVSLGLNGYLQKTKAIMETAIPIKRAIGSGDIPGIKLMGDSQSSVIAFQTTTDDRQKEKLDIYQISSQLETNGWCLNPLQRPQGVHICITQQQIGKDQEFLQDLKEAVNYVSEHKKAKSEGMAPIYGMASTFPDRELVGDICMVAMDTFLKVLQ